MKRETSILHYEILNKLGEGGIGVVYKVRDTRLDRTVALKSLSPHLTHSEEDLQRFRREARAAAALNHPHICTVHSIEEHDGEQFITMEYIDGQTLSEVLKSLKLDAETALRYAIQIADALSEAHEKGVIHRDIKPGNIMVDSKKQVKVLDFGLARLADSQPITQTGTTLGTMAYMAPEQIQGRTADHRADLFSFGVLLFEMLTGNRPFQGSYDAALTYAIVNDDPPLLTDVLPDLPKKLSALVSRLLEKDPANRYSSVGELSHDLKTCLDELTGLPHPLPNTGHKPETGITAQADSVANRNPGASSLPRSKAGFTSLAAGLFLVILTGYWLFPSEGSQAPPGRTIAVLPLENISREPDDMQFTDGVHEELINRLAGIGELTVIARSSVLGFAPGERDLQAIARELGVSSLLEGTVRRFEDRLKVSVQLIDVNSLGMIWSGSFEENIDDIFEIQSRIARQVAGELQASLTEKEKGLLDKRLTENPEAYLLYMQGRNYLSFSIFEKEKLTAARQLFSRSVELDPQFAQAWGMLAATYSFLYWWHGASPENLQRLQDAAERAERLSPDLPETQLAVGMYRYWSDTDYERTLVHFNAALRRFPNHPMLHRFTAATHRALGNWELLIHHQEEWLELDPLNHDAYSELAWNYWLMRDYDKALSYLDRLNELSPNEHVYFWLKATMELTRDGSLENYEIWWEHIRPSDPALEVPYRWGYYNTLKRNWEEALRGFKYIQGEAALNFSAMYIPREFLIAVALEAMGNHTEAFGYFRQVQKHLENLRDEYPEDARYRAALGKVYARLGEFEKAIREGERATELIPVSQDSEAGPFLQIELAEIYAWSGREEQAIDKLEYALSVPSLIHRHKLKLDPVWDPLRDHPRFQELISGTDEPYLEGL